MIQTKWKVNIQQRVQIQNIKLNQTDKSAIVDSLEMAVGMKGTKTVKTDLKF